MKSEAAKSKNKVRLSCTLATHNEEENIGRCLEAVRQLADEIVVVDGSSIDKTVEIAKKYGAKVIEIENPTIFHINKQKANDLAKGEWILQLDADEVVSKELANEIRRLVRTQNLESRIQKIPELFKRHQRLIEERDGKVGTGNPDDPVVAFFIPRRNYFLGRLLRYGGTYPDGVIRLFKKNKARLPCKDVHEQYEVEGRVGWLEHDLYHYDSPTFGRYLRKNNQYADLFADELEKKKTRLNWVNAVYYMGWKPMMECMKLYFRHKGFLDGFQGLVWAWYSGMTWRTAYVMYWEKNHVTRIR